ncbi:MAG: hypothetical protein E7350_02785 [Clostridiales bacterium]|nr:hypothetical protein [Clostridiales bacterium]
MVAVIVLFCFPLGGYKFSVNLGLERSALVFAEKYADKGNIDGLVYCVELDEELFSSTGKQKYADKMIAHTEEFFEYEDVYAYFDKLDEYYLDNSPAYTHVGLYSYYEYVVSCNYVARCAVGDGDNILLDGEEVGVVNVPYGELNEAQTAIVYSAVAKAIASGNMDVGLLYDDGGFTEFYTELSDSVPQFLDSLGGSDTLQTLFLMRSVISVADEIGKLFDSLGIDISADWQCINDYTYGGSTLHDAYTALYLDYIKG